MALRNEHIIDKTYPVTGMSCAACASSVEKVLKNQDGVVLADVNLASNEVHLKVTESTSSVDLKTALQEIGFDLLIKDSSAKADAEEARNKLQHERYRNFIGAGVFSIPILIIGMFFPDWITGRYISFALTIPVLFYFGRSFFIRSYKGLSKGLVNMDTLVSLSTGVAFIFSSWNTFFPEVLESRGFEAYVYFEAAAVIIFFVLLGKWIEEKAKNNSSKAIEHLVKLQPESALRIDEKGEIMIGFQEIQKGDTIQVNPGARVPVDGLITQGETFLDESLLSGEALPLRKTIGDKVFAGTLNQNGSFTIQSTVSGSDTVLSRIIESVKIAQASKAPVQRYADKVAGIFVPIVLILAALSLGLWLIIGGSEFLAQGILSAVSVLVIACPCALGLATPTAVSTALGRGAEMNILIREAASFEIANEIDHIVLDKTGTITEGRPSVVDSTWYDEIEKHGPTLYGIELKSEHPLSFAVNLYLQNKGIKRAEVSNVENLAGKGMIALDPTGDTFIVGNEDLLNSYDLSLNPEQLERVRKWRERANTVIFFFSPDKILSILAVNDPIKGSSYDAVKTLQNDGYEISILSGDHIDTVKSVADTLSINTFQAGILPDQKAEVIRNLQLEGRKVAMVGDGVNDSEALTISDLGIAMGHGAAITNEVSKITLINSDLATLPVALKLSKATLRVIKQNLFWAFIYNLIGIPIAAGLLFPVWGFMLNPMMASAAMALSSISVVLNSLRLRKIQIK